MIGSLCGLLAMKSPPHLRLEVAGVGYELEAPMSTFYELPAVGQQAKLLTHLVVREDAHLLFGFATEAERVLFRHLLKISGIGPRIALAILSGVTGAAFAQAVREHDAAVLTRIPGVGRKTAERLIVEMRDRLEQAPVISGVLSGAAPNGDSAEAEAYSALVALGYKPQEATRLLKGVALDSAGAVLSSEELIRKALQSAARA